MQVKIKNFLLFFIIFIFFTSQARAQVILTEVYPAPTDSETEWVEIYNSSEQAVDLSGWTLWDKLSSSSLIFEFDNILEPDGYSIANISNKLNNSADSVILKNNLGELIDEMSYESSQNDKSWALINNTWVLTDPSFGKANPALVSPSPVVSPSPSPSPEINFKNYNLKITDFNACPESGDAEWVELQNNSDQDYELTNWYFLDSANNKKKFEININAGQVERIELSSSILNNSGDSIFLYSADDDLIDQIEYTNCGQKPEPTPDSSPDPVASPQSNLEPSSTPLAEISPIHKNYYFNYQPDIFLTSTKSSKLKNKLITFSQTWGKWPVIFVIIGGICLISSASLLFYEKTH